MVHRKLIKGTVDSNLKWPLNIKDGMSDLQRYSLTLCLRNNEGVNPQSQRYRRWELDMLLFKCSGHFKITPTVPLNELENISFIDKYKKFDQSWKL